MTFVVNGSQAVGAAPLDLAALDVDALVSCGFKWLCGPYATGFCWLRHLLGLGIDRVGAFDQRLVERLLQGLDPDR